MAFIMTTISSGLPLFSSSMLIAPDQLYQRAVAVIPSTPVLASCQHGKLLNDKASLIP
uniref:Uncharacterized protein n=1 Tax=Tetranychus urticae TaxID=32264 RepID=T1JST6_TETUR